MPSSHTTRNRLEKQAPGENQDTWGERLNDNTIDLADEALDGIELLTVSGSVTLTSASDATDQARKRALWCTGNGGTIVIPNVQKVYHVYNGTSGNLVISTGTGGTATVRPGNGQTVICNGSGTCQALNVTDFGASSIETTGPAKFGAITRSAPDKGHMDLANVDTGVNLVVSATGAPASATALGTAYGLGFSKVGAASFLSGFATGVGGWGAFVSGNGTARIFLDGDNGRVHIAAGTFSGFFVGPTKVVGPRAIGWTAPASTLNRAAFSDSTVTLQQLAQRVAALIVDLTGHGLIGA